MKRHKIIFFFIIFLIYSACVNIVHPITVKYVTQLSLPDAYFGFFVSLMSLGQVVGAIIFGFLSDKIGRKWLIVLGMLGYCLSQFGFGFINQYPIVILIFRFLAGVCISAPNTLFVSMCVDYSKSDNKVRMLSLLNSCSILGAAIGYEVGGVLYDYANLSISEVFIFQICLTIFTAMMFSLLIKDAYKAKSVKNIDVSEKKQISIKPIVYLLLISLTVLTIAQILINKYLDTYLIHTGHNPAELGHYVLITGIVGAISNIAIIPLIKKIKNKMLSFCLLGLILLSAILTICTFAIKTDIFYLLFTTHFVYIIIKGWITPLEQNELAMYINNTNNGKITGIRQTMLSIGNVFGPLIGSAIYVNGSPLIFIVAAFIIVLSFLMYIIYFLIKKKNKYDKI